MITGFLRILLYLAVGPLVGLIGASLAIGFGTLMTSGSFRDFSGWDALVSPQLLIFAYTVGAIPALLTAIVAIVIAGRVTGIPHWLWVALAGAAVSCILAWLVFGISPVAEGMRPVTFTTVFAAAGSLAGLVCAMLFDGAATLLGRR